MKKAFIYTQSLMNGTVTIETSVAAFATRELAEETVRNIKEHNAKCDLGGLRIHYGDIKEIDVYETKDEIPFYQKQINKKKQQ